MQTLEESLRSQTTLLEASEADYQALSKEMAKLSELATFTGAYMAVQQALVSHLTSTKYSNSPSSH